MTDEEKVNIYHLNNVTSEEVFYHAGMSEKVRKAFLDGLAEGRKELEQWKQEWQDAQIKANEEGFARTTLQIKYAELEKENAELSNSILEFSNSVIELTNSKTELESKFAELKEQNESLADTIIKAQDIIAELKKQIEKMKTHGNCKYNKTSVIDFPKEKCPCSNCSNYDKWELAE